MKTLKNARLVAAAILLGALFSLACTDGNTPPGTATTSEPGKPPPSATPTPIPPASACPVDAATCDSALRVRDAVARGDTKAIADMARPLSVACPSDPQAILGLQPLCAANPGTSQPGYSVGVYGKAFRVLDGPAFAAFLDESLHLVPGPGTVRSIGCGPSARGGSPSVDCTKGFALTVGYGSPSAGELALVLLFARSASDGSPGLVGLRRWVLDGAVVDGGPEDLGQEGFPFDGKLWFLPWEP